MAHFAFLDASNVVVQVITGKDEDDHADGITDWESYYGELHGMTCKRTSYWTRGGVHLNGGEPFRKNFAGIGFTYDSDRDAFIPPKPSPEAVLDEESCLWVIDEHIPGITLEPSQ